MENSPSSRAREILADLRGQGYKVFLDARLSVGVFPLLHPTKYNSVMQFRDELKELLKKEQGA